MDEIQKESDIEFEYKYINFICSNPDCRNFVILEVKNEDSKDDPVQIMKTIKCKKCGHIGFDKTDKTKKQIDEEKLKLKKLEKNKEDLEKGPDKNHIKKTISQISDELKDIKKDLTNDLNKGDITPERFSALMINLSFVVYRYYRKNADIDMFASDIRDYAYSTSKNALSKKYAIDEVDDVLESVLKEYDEKSDLEYLIRAKRIAQENLFGKTGLEAEEILADIADLENSIVNQERIGKTVEKIESEAYQKAESKNENTFINELRKGNNV